MRIYDNHIGLHLPPNLKYIKIIKFILYTNTANNTRQSNIQSISAPMLQSSEPLEYRF